MSRMRGAIPPFSQYIFMAWFLVKHRDIFTFYLYFVDSSETQRKEHESCRKEVFHALQLRTAP
jgi:hypothetical protein